MIVPGDPDRFNRFAYDAMIADSAALNAMRLAAGMSELEAQQAGALATVTAGFEALPAAQKSQLARRVFVPAYLSGSDTGPNQIDMVLFMSIVGVRNLTDEGGGRGRAPSMGPRQVPA